MSIIQDFENTCWGNDIDSFTRWKTFLQGVKTYEVRKRVIGRMLEIQKRWPQYISIEEVPSE